MDQRNLYLALISKIQPLVTHFNKKPLHVHAGVKLTNFVLIPKIIYMLECVSPHLKLLIHICDALFEFLKSI